MAAIPSAIGFQGPLEPGKITQIPVEVLPPWFDADDGEFITNGRLPNGEIVLLQRRPLADGESHRVYDNSRQGWGRYTRYGNALVYESPLAREDGWKVVSADSAQEA